MIPEDYEPYGETGPGKTYNYGDYPKFEPRSCDERPGHRNYDYAWIKRDFGEWDYLQRFSAHLLKVAKDQLISKENSKLFISHFYKSIEGNDVNKYLQMLNIVVNFFERGW